MFFNLNRYLTSENECVIHQFGISLRFIIITLSLWTMGLGGLSYGLQYLDISNFLERLPLIILMLINVYYVLYFLTTVYFVTNTKIYKRIGIGFMTVTSAKHTEIDDMKIKQSFLERILFNTGTLKFNTLGSDRYEIILPRVGEPFSLKRILYEAWNK